MHEVPARNFVKVLVDFIITHHGTTRVEYFYRTYQKENPDLEVNPIDFTYPGPKPASKEQAIMMMADSLEAASKSLKFPKEKHLLSLGSPHASTTSIGVAAAVQRRKIIRMSSHSKISS